MNNIPPKVQNQVMMLQQVQQQLQTIIQQKTQYEMMAKEARKAEEELKSVADDAEVFVHIGGVMMQKEKDTVISDLAEKIETFELRLKSLEKQEKTLQQKFEQLQTQIRSALEAGSPPVAH